MSYRRFILPLCVLAPHLAFAYLGDFEAADGYLGNFSTTITTLNLGSDWQDGSGYVPDTLGLQLGSPDLYQRAGPDLSRYNAGSYGTGGGGSGGSATDIVDNAGLWTANLGGRLTVDASNGASPLNYVTAHGGSAKSGSNFLAIRAIDADLDYNYTVDSRDLGGVGPNSVTDGTYSMGFWFCPGQVITPGGTTDNIFGLTFLDGVGTAGLAFGYNGQGAIQYELGGSGIWNTSSVNVGVNDWSYASIIFDTTTDTASMSISPWVDVSSSLGGSVNLFTNLSMGVDMDALTTLNWQLDGGMDKNFFDNVSMSVTPVPEPAGSLFLLFAGLRVLLQRRRTWLNA